MQTSKTQLHALNGLKVFAILLVFNSHCGDLYPIPSLATGGALGNALFFVISGYLLKIPDTPFLPWIKKRIIRLYPEMFIVSVIYAVVFQYYPDNFLTFVTRFIWPTGYWFIGGLLLFNIIIFFFEKWKVFARFNVYSVVLWIIYFMYYIFLIDKTTWTVEEHGLFRLIYYFYIYTLGYCIKNKKITLDIGNNLALIIAGIAFMSHFIWKLVMNKFPLLMTTQCMCQVFGVIFALFLLIYALGIEKKYCRLPKKLINGLDFWSAYSLEIYLSQRTVQRIARLTVFPVNIVLAVALTLLYALSLKWITNVRLKGDYHENK